MSADLLRRAAVKLREHATAAHRGHPDQQWMVDHSPDYGLILGSFVPEDIDDDGVVSTGCIAFFAYPGDEESRAYAGAVDVASYMAAMHPPVALALADWLEAAHDHLGNDKHYAAALSVARAVLREDGEPR